MELTVLIMLIAVYYHKLSSPPLKKATPNKANARYEMYVVRPLSDEFTGHEKLPCQIVLQEDLFYNVHRSDISGTTKAAMTFHDYRSHNFISQRHSNRVKAASARYAAFRIAKTVSETTILPGLLHAS